MTRAVPLSQMNSGVVVDGAAGSTRAYYGTTAGSVRWEMDLGNATAEGGSNAGSDYALKRYTDAGALIDTPMSISRKTGVVTFSQAPIFPGGGYLPLSGGTLTGALGGTAATFSGALNGNTGVFTGAFSAASVTSSGGVYAGTVFVDYPAATDFYLALSGGNRILNWSSNWYDAWTVSSGLRSWYSPSGVAMALTGGGVLSTLGAIYPCNLNGDMNLSASSSERYMQFAGGWYWGWNTSTGTLRWVGGGASTPSEYYTFSPGGLTIQGGKALNVTGSITANSANFSGSCNAGPSTIGGVVLQSSNITTNNGAINAGQGVITSNNHVPFGNNAASVGVSGQAWFQCMAYAFPNASDPRDKKNIEYAPSGALDRINSVPIYTYNWYTEKDSEPTHTGWLADEVQAALSQHSQALVVVGEDERQSLATNLNEMVAVLWQAVQELTAKVATLEAAR